MSNLAPLELLVHDARIVDVFRLRVTEGWIGVRDGRFVYVEAGQPPPGISAAVSMDAEGRYIIPGLIDAHMHIESSLVTPQRFAEAAVPHGTTAVLADPHEVANVAGEEGVRWMIRASSGLPLHIFYAIPSCVPATSPELEWTAAVFDADVVDRLAQEPSVIALGEVMDYGQVLAGGARLRGMTRAALAAGLRVEGHVPTLHGTDLSEYLSWGITSDHTLATPDKIAEQVSKGLAVMLQAKSCTSQNLAAVNGLPDRSAILLVTDDVEPSLLARGHLSSIVQLAVSAGMPAVEALSSATIRPARYLGLRDLGGIAPGMQADFCLLDGLPAFPPAEVYISGRLVARGGAPLLRVLPAVAPPALGSLPGPFDAGDFRFAGPGDRGEVVANAVTIMSSTTSLTGLAQIPVQLEDGYAAFQQGDDLALVSVVARNRSSQSTGVVQGLGWREGALASTFAHDCHNLLVLGRDAGAMAAAANAVRTMGGGMVALVGEQIVASLPLPILGLLSDAPLARLIQEFEQFERALRDLGIRHTRPFLMVSLLALSVSPRYKFTDRGVIDTEARRLLPPWSRLD